MKIQITFDEKKIGFFVTAKRTQTSVSMWTGAGGAILDQSISKFVS